MANKKKKITFDVYGVCTSRDIFGLVPNEMFEVKKYYQLSYPPLFDDSYLFNINPLDADDINQSSGYFRRTAIADINRTALSGLQKSNADWIIIDVRSVPKGLWEATFGGETHYYSGDSIVRKDSIERSINAKGLEMESFKKITYDELPDADAYIDKFCYFLKERYGKNIILVELKEALWLLDKEGNVSFRDDCELEDRCRQMDECFLKFLDRLDCYYIRTPVNVLYDSYNHFGDAHRVHYVQEWYDYANKCVELIVSGDKNWLKKMDRLNIELTNLFDGLRGKNLLSRTNTCKRFETQYKKVTSSQDIELLIQEMSDAVQKTKDQIFQSEIQGRIGRIYRDRKDGKSDYVKAAEWMRRASNNGLGWAKNELFDILWRINTPDSTLEMINLAYAFANQGDAPMAGRIGRAYRDGIGVPKNLDAAEKWMKESVTRGCIWAKIEYFDILWRKNTSVSLKTMIEFGLNESNNGNMELRARLARAYRDGKGVEKDLVKAAALMKTVLTGNPRWAKWEYIDILRIIDSPDTNTEAFTFANSLLVTGDREIEARVARMYRDGKGVEKDLDKAIELMHSAANKDLRWAKIEFCDMIWDKKDSVLDEEALSILIKMVEMNDKEALLRLEKFNMGGRGSKADLVRAEELIRGSIIKR